MDDSKAAEGLQHPQEATVAPQAPLLAEDVTSSSIVAGMNCSLFSNVFLEIPIYPKLYISFDF